MKNIFSKFKYHKIKNYIFAHKIISAVVLMAVLFGGYEIYKNYTSTTTQTKYIVTAVEKGTVVSVVSGSGQVSASSQIELKSNASGNLQYIGIADGKDLKAGDLIAQIDSKNAAISLENARLSLEKLTESADAVSMSQAQNALDDSIQSNKKASDSLASSYNSALSSVAAAFIDMPSVIDGMNTIFYTSNGTLNDIDSANLPIEARQYRADAGLNFDKSKTKYLVNLDDYKSISSNSSTSSIENLIRETLDTTNILTLAVKEAKNTIDYTQNQGNTQPLRNLSTTQANLNNWLSKLSGHLDDLTNITNSIQDSKNTLSSSARDITAKTLALEKLKTGADQLDIRQQQLAVAQQEINYGNYFIRAPFDGMIAKTDVNKGDYIGGGTTVATFITKQQVAEITLNEVDVAKVKVGQKATLTFDAVDGLTITGQVLEVDLAGTVTQGVVSYAVKIGFDTQDNRVRSGMSASASIATDVHQDVLIVPSGAVKTKNGSSYVEVFDNSTPVSTNTAGTVSFVAPNQKNVVIGIADDLNTEIVSGLSEGDKVVSKTITSTQTTTTKTPSILSAATSGGRNVTP